MAPFANLSDPPSDATTWAALAALGIIYTGLVFTLQYGAIQRLPTHLVAALYFIYPAIAVTVDVMELGNRLHAIQVIGIATILLAAAGMNTAWPVSATKSRARP
jgi:drug/metabolite transporter (DMT)-like permease